MRWWLNTDPPKIFSVDNAAVKGMDFSTLAADVWMIQWTEGKGEIERQDDDGNNLNGLREVFIDIIPYCPFFQQFLTLLKAKALLLPQAKKVQVDLINEVYNSKRQAPYHYPVASGDYYWDATDSTLNSSTAAGLQSAIATVNALVDKVNNMVAAINANVVAGVNARFVAPGNSVIVQANSAYSVIVSGVNGNAVAGMNSALLSLASEINADFSGIAGEIASNIVGTGNSTIAHLNNTVLGTYDGGTAGTPETVNNKLQNTTPGSAPTIYGLTADIAPNGFSFFGVSTYGVSTYSISGISGDTTIESAFTDINAIPWTNQGHVPVATANWIPVGATAPVPVTPAEQAAILAGISARAADLNVKRNVKIGEVNALTTIDDVIDYDVTTGW